MKAQNLIVPDRLFAKRYHLEVLELPEGIDIESNTDSTYFEYIAKQIMYSVTFFGYNVAKTLLFSIYS